mgnify:CR=1 FL=1
MHSILNNLNKEQKSIAFSKHNRIFVNAGPGTGKTHTIVAFVVNLVVNKHIPPHEIRILTFTKRTSSMMKKRLRKELGKEISPKLKVSTFHSMAYAYMAKRGFLDGRRQALSADFSRLAKAIIRNKNCELTPSELCDEVIKVGRMASYNTKKNENYKWFTAFYNKLDTANLWEFDFLLNKMIEYLRNNLPELRKLRNAYKYIIVDEYQDCNENQIELLKLLVGKKGKFLFVGDPDQMIYHWRGAKMTYSINIEKHFKNVTIKNLTINYRFGRKIGIVANDLISNNDNRLPKVLKVHRKENGIVSCKHSNDDIEQLRKISRILKTAKGNSAVLCYTNDLSNIVANFLKEKGFKVFVIDENTKSQIGKDDICVMTCHASKGLEFDNVLIPYFIEYFSGKGEANRRLFYVAMTRAKQNLYLFSIDKFQSNGAYIRCKPSQFLKEIGF